MADKTKHESITETVTQSLADWIKEQSLNVRQTIIGFPASNMRLRMPSVSVMATAPEFMPSPNPYLKNTISERDIRNNQADAVWVIGDYDFSLQIDLWCGNKEELDDIYDELFNILNPRLKPGLVLNMKKYFNTNCHYLYVGHDRVNSDANSQTDEWRMTFNVIATCKAIRSKKEFIIRETQIETDIRSEFILNEND